MCNVTTEPEAVECGSAAWVANDNQSVVYVGVLSRLPGACLNRVCVY